MGARGLPGSLPESFTTHSPARKRSPSGGLFGPELAGRGVTSAGPAECPLSGRCLVLKVRPRASAATEACLSGQEDKIRAGLAPSIWDGQGRVRGDQEPRPESTPSLHPCTPSPGHCPPVPVAAWTLWLPFLGSGTGQQVSSASGLSRSARAAPGPGWGGRAGGGVRLFRGWQTGRPPPAGGSRAQAAGGAVWLRAPRPRSR